MVRHEVRLETSRHDERRRWDVARVGVGLGAAPAGSGAQRDSGMG